METRINLQEIAPGAYKAMGALQNYLATGDLPPALKELIKIRASIINGCAYCIHLHTADALKLGEPVQKLFALAAWIESPLFDTKERAVLRLTDEVTGIGAAGVATETYNKVRQHYTESQLAQLLMQIITINAWNRIAVSTHMVHS
jgi:AhpD family alkylhydroperoxidase